MKEHCKSTVFNKKNLAKEQDRWGTPLVNEYRFGELTSNKPPEVFAAGTILGVLPLCSHNTSFESSL